MARLITCTAQAQSTSTFDCRIPDGSAASTAFVVFLFAIFCAHRAMSTRRNGWLWFFAGLFSAPITGLVLLYRTSQDLRPAQ